jgi:hypothetical protein
VSNNRRGNPTEGAPDLKTIEAPVGLDLHPKPKPSLRISRRAGLAIGVVVLGLLSSFVYGAYRRQSLAQVAAREASLPTALGPTTGSASEVEKDIPIGNASLMTSDPNQLHPPGARSMPTQPGAPASAARPCGFDPRTRQPYGFNPDTGQPCATDGHGRAGGRQAPQFTQPKNVTAVPEMTTEERRLAMAYQREHEAMVAPTAISSGATSFPAPTSGNDELARIAALGQVVAGRGSVERIPAQPRRRTAACPGRRYRLHDPRIVRSVRAARSPAACVQRPRLLRSLLPDVCPRRREHQDLLASIPGRRAD